MVLLTHALIIMIYFLSCFTSLDELTNYAHFQHYQVSSNESFDPITHIEVICVVASRSL